MFDQELNVLLVEDDEDDYLLTCELLKEVQTTKFNLHWVTNYDAGLQELRSNAHQVALIDQYFEGRTGIDLVQEASRAGCVTPMIMLTGLGDRDIDFAAMEAGAADYLEKSNLSAELIERSIRYAIAAAEARGALLERSMLLRTTLDNTGSGIGAFDQSMRLIAWNERFLDMLEIKKGFESLDGLSSNHGSEVVRLSERAVQRLQLSCYSQERLSEFTDGDGRVIEVCYNQSADGGVVVVCLDVTQRKRSERMLVSAKEAAELANRSKSAFLANISHELRTPLNGVIGMAQLLGREELKDEQRKLLDILITSARHQLTLVNDLVDLTRIESDRLELDYYPFDLCSVISDSVALVEEKAKSKGLTIEITLPDNAPSPLIGDPVRIKQICLNLLDNAVKFTDSGSISFAASTQTASEFEKVEFTVRDTGIGIKDEDQKHIFTRFVQVDSSMTRSAEGLGLGLPICQAIANAMDGHISLKSSPGEGSTFVVSLNLPREDVYKHVVEVGA